MKKKNALLSVTGWFLLLTIVTASCCEKNESITLPPVIDKEAGSFVVTNLTEGNILRADADDLQTIFVGDTISIVFHPKDEYAKKRFKITCDSFDNISDTLFLVRNQDVATGNIAIGKSLRVSATCSEKTETSEYDLSASQTFAVITYPSTADVTYSLIISSDLLQFITAEIAYTAEEGIEQTIAVGDMDWKRMTWTSGQESLEFCYYDFSVHYERLDRIYSVEVRYKAKTGFELTKESYDFDHSVQVKEYQVAGRNQSGIDISIDITSDDSSTKHDAVEEYIASLITTPDVLSVYLDKKNGTLNKR